MAFLAVVGTAAAGSAAARVGDWRMPGGHLTQQELLAADRASGDVFGGAVSISADGRVALIGALGKDHRGAAYVFVRDGSRWTEMQELRAPDGALDDEFGVSVSLSADGRLALIGASGKDGGTGAVYVFARHGGRYLEQQELQPSDGGSGDQFGQSLSLGADGRVALIGAYAKDGFKGAAYVFTDDGGGYVQQQELHASDGGAGDEFGSSWSLGASGRVALTGAPNREGLTGAAYLFDASRRN